MLRTVPPAEILPLARAHDSAILNAFTCLFQIPAEDAWNHDLHRVTFEMVARQAQLPISLAVAD